VGWTAEKFGFDCRQWQKIFLFFTAFCPQWDARSWYRGLFPGANGAGAWGQYSNLMSSTHYSSAALAECGDSTLIKPNFTTGHDINLFHSLPFSQCFRERRLNVMLISPFCRWIFPKRLAHKYFVCLVLIPHVCAARCGLNDIIVCRMLFRRVECFRFHFFINGTYLGVGVFKHLYFVIFPEKWLHFMSIQNSWLKTVDCVLHFVASWRGSFSFPPGLVEWHLRNPKKQWRGVRSEVRNVFSQWWRLHELGHYLQACSWGWQRQTGVCVCIVGRIMVTIHKGEPLRFFHLRGQSANYGVTCLAWGCRRSWHNAPLSIQYLCDCHFA
jgi:hypothetical protein